MVEKVPARKCVGPKAAISLREEDSISVAQKRLVCSSYRHLTPPRRLKAIKTC